MMIEFYGMEDCSVERTPIGFGCKIENICFLLSWSRNLP